MQPATHSRGTSKRVFGFPLRGFSLFQGMLLSVSAALLAFCVTTMVSIFVLLFLKLHSRPHIDMAISYRDIGFPVAIIVLVIALPTFAILWLRGKFQQVR